METSPLLTEATPDDLLQQTLLAAEACFSSRQFLNGSITTSLLRALHQYGKDHFIHDGMDNGRLSYSRLLAASLALSDYLLTQTDKPRVGIILPPGKGGLIANLAVLFAGKIPVNLNFTAAKGSVDSAISQADLDYFITAQKFVEKLPTFPWPDPTQMLMLDTMVKKLKPAALKWMIKLRFCSTDSLIKKRKLDQRSNHDEAVLLFTSGSSGTPKGVPLSHRNLLANICQFGSRLDFQAGSSMLGCLPLFHSFGLTVTTFFPLLEGYNLVTYASPLETKKLAELIQEHNITLLTATPTFLRGYIRRAEPEQLAGLKYVVTAAEKLPKNLAETFYKRFGKYPLEGYGLTETSPASYLSLPAPETTDEATLIPTEKAGTVGLPLVGVAIKITDPITDEELPLSQAGCVWLRGANIFSGYIGQPELNAEVLQDGWFNTGDIGRVDAEGFLTLEGRLSRFSKIAGEMVPHELVEAEINKVLGLDQEEVRHIAIVGVPDEKKGEALVLLTSLQEYDAGTFMSDLKKKLIEADIPALWCPRSLVYTPQIPILASGKLDLAGCRQAVLGE